ncbi:aminoglycoside phosphotransferase [Hypoxylon sp. FL1150]|nr:aminoglycoside phosphotransferase [Hypoxylon sp. FL1150]
MRSRRFLLRSIFHFNDVLLEYLIAREFATLKFFENNGTPTPKAYAFDPSSDPDISVGYAGFLISINRLLVKQAYSLHLDGGKVTEAAVVAVSEYPKEAFLFFRLLKDRAAPILAAAGESTEGFFLKNVDDMADHILIDEDSNVTGIVDWQCSRFVPACEAFGPSLLTVDLGNLHNGRLGLRARDEILTDALKQKGRKDLAQYAGGSELARRVHFGLASR